MIHIKRFPEPRCLSENGERWLKAFLENSSSSPNGRQYGHPDVRDVLHAMSSNKCFYCEQKLDEAHIEHYIEVSEQSELAFEWTNLYLSCPKCNHAKRQREPAITDCLDPCDDTHDPAVHLYFERNLIRPRAESELGVRMIQKYRLNRNELDYKRLKQLQLFCEFVMKLRRPAEGYTDDQRERIQSFAQSDHEYSLMFRIYVDNLDI